MPCSACHARLGSRDDYLLSKLQNAARFDVSKDPNEAVGALSLTPRTGDHEEQHRRLASLPGLIKDQWALGIWSVLGAAVHGKKGREKAYVKIILRHVDAGHTAGASRLLLSNLGLSKRIY